MGPWRTPCSYEYERVSWTPGPIARALWQGVFQALSNVAAPPSNRCAGLRILVGPQDGPNGWKSHHRHRRPWCPPELWGSLAFTGFTRRPPGQPVQDLQSLHADDLTASRRIARPCAPLSRRMPSQKDAPCFIVASTRMPLYRDAPPSQAYPSSVTWPPGSPDSIAPFRAYL